MFTGLVETIGSEYTQQLTTVLARLTYPSGLVPRAPRYLRKRGRGYLPDHHELRRDPH